MLHRQPPAWSPIGLSALWTGLTTGTKREDRVQGLREMIRAQFASFLVVLTDSGTSALALAIGSSGRAGHAPRVALPAYGCFDLMTAADAAGAEVVLYDLDPDTLSPDLPSLRRAFSHRPDSVVVAHWYGVPVDLGPVEELAGAAGVTLIEDAAQSVGSVAGGLPAGARGEFGVLSFGRGKGRSGGGGALLARSREAAAALESPTRQLRPAHGKFGRLAALGAEWAFGRPALYGIPSALPFLRLGETVYHRAWAAGRMHPASAAVVQALWSASDREALRRQASGDRWLRDLDTLGCVRCVTPSSGARPGWLRFPLLASDSALGFLRSPEAGRRGIITGYPRTLADLHRPLIEERSSFPGARALARTLVTLPTHSYVTAEDQRFIADRLQAIG
jgi:dTDP-4-amino-4,6-dideoxygalactose transaminase